MYNVGTSFSETSTPSSGEAAATQHIEFDKPLETFGVPSIGSTAKSNLWLPGFQGPRCPPLKMPGALSLLPSPITTSPQTFIRSNIPRIASQAAASANSFSPRPIQGSVLSAAASVARIKSSSIILSTSAYGSLSKRIPKLYPLLNVKAKNLFGGKYRAIGGGTAIPIIYRCDRNKLIPISGCRSFIGILTDKPLP